MKGEKLCIKGDDVKGFKYQTKLFGLIKIVGSEYRLPKLYGVFYTRRESAYCLTAPIPFNLFLRIPFQVWNWIKTGTANF